MPIVNLNRNSKKCVFCKYWNGAIGSITIQILPGGNTFQFENTEKHSCFKKGRGMQTSALQECPYFIEIYEEN